MTNLIDEFLSLPNFRQAWFKVADNKGCAGIDGETIEHFALNLDFNLTFLLNSVTNSNYIPQPLKQVLIPKSQEKWRELRIPTVRDRIVQQALLNVLYPVMEERFSDASFAYRPNRSYLDAVKRAAYWRDLGYQWVLDADIVEYFDNISHSLLLKEVRKTVDNSGILCLIKAWISAGVSTDKGIIFPEKGVPQGAVISPMLANIYLDEFDHRITQSDLKLVRYADDFLVLSDTEDGIMRAYSQVVQLLHFWGLKLHEEKTQITHFKKGFQFLGHGFLRKAIFPIDDQVKSSKSSLKKKSRQRVRNKRVRI
ncbi:RNA-directed DNA polymerase (Reverse transcriptase) (plasmid) [Gloeothece citriformis PCC 7424]|uniref:RNA-directed DNA polymerase (Reverse transcriptase) n=1 Tax=Gloeothece citriformis (strain PCC 7424) TaxID=65393 RepID=B7KM76_GLOC7|nr:group II intron reverse transcriptase/maturase [Gloeothece citriformis]ACK73898.1 RNA-directed DNA polymerase (Reverse transcriptase) [Gloeothece citriformis PCC 7424]